MCVYKFMKRQERAWHLSLNLTISSVILPPWVFEVGSLTNVALPDLVGRVGQWTLEIQLPLLTHTLYTTGVTSGHHDARFLRGCWRSGLKSSCLVAGTRAGLSCPPCPISQADAQSSATWDCSQSLVHPNGRCCLNFALNHRWQGCPEREMLISDLFLHFFLSNHVLTHTLLLVDTEHITTVALKTDSYISGCKLSLANICFHYDMFRNLKTYSEHRNCLYFYHIFKTLFFSMLGRS